MDMYTIQLCRLPDRLREQARSHSKLPRHRSSVASKLGRYLCSSQASQRLHLTCIPCGRACPHADELSKYDAQSNEAQRVGDIPATRAIAAGSSISRQRHRELKSGDCDNDRCKVWLADTGTIDRCAHCPS